MRHLATVHRMMLTSILSITLLLTVLSTPGRAQTPPDDCAQPVPVDDVTVGMAGHGLTVIRDNDPVSFRAEVLGVLEDGIFLGSDLIVADLQSPAVEANGVWAGMSGSPVYADDGRLIGAVSYVLAGSPSTIAGITPAETMFELYDYPGATTGRQQPVPLPAAVQRRAVAESDATVAQVRDGMTPLPLPLAISGIRAGRMNDVAGHLGEPDAFVPYRSNSSAPAATTARADADAADIVPGSNFAAAVSYGDITAAGVGTTTDVCRGTALAFGHSMLHQGRTSLSAHTAEALVIQPDPHNGGGFKVANIGGVVGTVDQDRLAGLRAPLGDAPTPAVVTSRTTSMALDRERTGRTWVNRTDMVPYIAALHAYNNLERMMDRVPDYGAPVDGRIQLSWTARGTRANGSAWKVTRTNRFADRQDPMSVAYREIRTWLGAIQTNRFAKVDIDKVTMTGSVDDTYQRLRFGDVRIAVNGGAYRKISAIDRLRVRAGDTIRARVPLLRFQQETPSRTVNLSVKVPARLAGRSMRFAVVGGANLQGEANTTIDAARSFNDIVTRMNGAAGSDAIVARLQVSGDAGPQVLVNAKKTLDNVVGGRRSVPVTVAR